VLGIPHFIEKYASMAKFVSRGGSGPSFFNDTLASALTVVIPTRNRSAQCAAQLEMLRKCGVGCRILVADSSDAAQAADVRRACGTQADYVHFDPALRIIDKWNEVIPLVETPYVVMTPDDDITFPHAIAASLQALIDNPDYAAAHGYVLNFGVHHDYFDIHSTFSFTPTISDDDPLNRHYDLMRRYQPFIWAVFRTQTFASALKAAAAIDGTIFQEITFMNTAVLAGKVMRLPVVYAMRGPEESLSAKSEIDPFFWYLRDAGGFFAHYHAYRNKLADQVRSMGLTVKSGASVEQLLDVIHGTWLGRAVNVGMINHTARHLLGDDIAAIVPEPVWSGWRDVANDDQVHDSGKKKRKYVWRAAVMTAGDGEVDIGAEEIALVEQQLDFYR